MSFLMPRICLRRRGVSRRLFADRDEHAFLLGRYLLMFVLCGIVSTSAAFAASNNPVPVPTTMWVANDSSEFAVLMPVDGWQVQHDVWEYGVEYQYIERMEFVHASRAVIWIEVWKNPRALGLTSWMGRNADVMTFTPDSASAATVSAGRDHALRHDTGTPPSQTYQIISTLFAHGDKVYQVSYLKADGGLMQDVYDRLLDTFSFSPSGDWEPSSTLNDLWSRRGTSPLGFVPEVYSCGGEQDTCLCGASNPFPCCDGVGNCTWHAWHAACCNWGKNIPPRGNANTWRASFLANSDYEVVSSSSPKAGDVAMSGSGGYGHVAYVISVSGDNVTVTEQNCPVSGYAGSGLRTKTYAKTFFTHGYARPKPKTGSIRVTIEPAGARSAGAQWRRTGTSTWRNSGATESGVAPGGHTVEFKAISNWDKPANASVTVTAGGTATMTKSYTRHTGSLSVTIEPADARTAGAQWRRTGTSTWRNSGTTEGSIETGTYTVEFSALASPWVKPANISAAITKGATTSKSVRYNRPPVFTAPGNHFVHVGSLLRYSVKATDADGDAITLSVSGVPSGATLSATGGVGTLNFTPTVAHAGSTYNLSFKAVDALGASVSASSSIEVGIWPQITAIPAQRARVGELLEFSVQASDANGDAITLSLLNAPTGASFSATGGAGTFQFTPTAAQGGEVHNLIFTAADIDGVSTSSVNLIVGAAPVIESIDDLAVLAGETASFVVQASDSNGDVKTFSMSGAPEGATLTGSGDSRAFSYQASEADKGKSFDIVITVSDMDGSATAHVQLRIQGPPEFAGLPPQRIAVTNTLELAIEAIDPDGDAMVFSASNLPPGAVFAPGESGGAFVYTPALEDAAQVYTAQFFAAAVDGVGVLEVPIVVGAPPTLDAPETVIVAEYNSVEFTVIAADANAEDTLVIEAGPLPPNAVFATTGSVGTLTFTPASFQGGQEYTLTFTASDNVDGYAVRETLVRVLDDDMYEQNDSLEEAANFTPYEGIARPAKQSDDDWYLVDVPFGRQRISATIQYVTSTDTLSLQLLDKNGVVLGEGAPTGSGISIDVRSPYFGPHYLLVAGNNLGTGYQLVWNSADSSEGCEGGDDVYAPNESVEEAASITVGEWLSDQRGVGIAGTPDWYVVEVPGGEEFLSVTGVYGQVESPLRVNAYDRYGALVGTADGADGVIALNTPLESPGPVFIEVRSIGVAQCIPYNLIASTAPRENAPVEYLTGRYLRLPVATEGQPGRWLAPEPSEGARYNPEGIGGRAGTDFWGNIPALVNHVIGVGGATVRTNGIGWFAGPTITRLSAATWNRLAIDGEPVEGLELHRLLSFEENDSVLVVRDSLVNRGEVGLSSLITMDSVNPTPDYAAELRTSNDVVAVMGSADMTMASSVKNGATLAFGSVSAAAVPDASFLSRVNPYTVLSSPGDPDGAVANLSLKLLMNHGTIEPGGTNEALWYVVFATNSASAREAFMMSVMRNEWADDAFEPNNTLSSASDLSGAQGEWIYAVQANDDWYAIEVPIGVQDVRARLRFAAAHGEMELALYSRDGVELCTSSPDADGAGFSCVVPAHGTVYLRVFGEDSGNSYALEWSALSSWSGCVGEDDGLEPNNNRQAASALLSGEWASSQFAQMLTAGDEDWYMLDVPPEMVSLVVTCLHHAADGDLSLELYQQDGQLLAAADTTQDAEVLRIALPHEGVYYLRVAPPESGATCNLYDLYWSGSAEDAALEDGLIHLYGHYLYLPIQATNEPGRFLLSDQSAGLRFDRLGLNSSGGVDVWRQMSAPASHIVAWNGAPGVVNGVGWAEGPVVEKLSQGSLNRAVISGMPAAGLRFTRDVSFGDEDKVIHIVDVLVNEGAVSIGQLVTMDAFDPNPDFAQGVVNTRNYILSVFNRPEMALAEAVHCGITLALVSQSPAAILDASFLSRQNPYTVLANPNHPNGQEANLSLKVLMNYGALDPGASVTGEWSIVVSSSRADAIRGFRTTAPQATALVDTDQNGLPDWWEIAHFGQASSSDGDNDADGMSNRDEYLAGTDPNDPTSVFQLDIDTTSAALPVLQWSVEDGRKATLLYGTNIAGPFLPLIGAPQDPGRHSVTDSFSESSSSFFYLRLDEPNE